MMPGMRGERRVGDAEAAEVFRRAAELAHGGAPAPAFDEAALVAVGQQAGLPEDVVRQALREQQLGLLEPPPRRIPRLEGGGVAEVDVIVPGDREEVLAALTERLGNRGLHEIARWGSRSRWAPEGTPLQRLLRAWRLRGQLQSLSRLDVRVASVGGERPQVRIRLEGRLGLSRVVAAVVAWTAVVFLGTLTIAGLSSVEQDGPIALLYTGLIFVLPMVGLVLGARATLRRIRHHARDVLAGTAQLAGDEVAHAAEQRRRYHRRTRRR